MGGFGVVVEGEEEFFCIAEDLFLGFFLFIILIAFYNARPLGDHVWRGLEMGGFFFEDVDSQEFVG